MVDNSGGFVVIYDADVKWNGKQQIHQLVMPIIVLKPTTTTTKLSF